MRRSAQFGRAPVRVLLSAATLGREAKLWKDMLRAHLRAARAAAHVMEVHLSHDLSALGEAHREQNHLSATPVAPQRYVCGVPCWRMELKAEREGQGRCFAPVLTPNLRAELGPFIFLGRGALAGWPRGACCAPSSWLPCTGGNEASCAW